MRDYQAKRNHYYIDDHRLYVRTITLIRDYPRMCQMREAILYESPKEPGGGHGPGRPTESKALRMATLDDDIRAIERALDKIPREYRQGVMDNIICRTRQADLPYASERTWRYQKAAFIWHVAKNKHWL